MESKGLFQFEMKRGLGFTCPNRKVYKSLGQSFRCDHFLENFLSHVNDACLIKYYLFFKGEIDESFKFYVSFIYLI